MFRFLLPLFITLLVDTAHSQLSVFGDARIRPRYDIDDKTMANGSRISDLYYQYRARL